MRTPLVGTAYTARSRNLNNQQCVNLYLETVETKDGTAPNALMPCPGLVVYVTLPTSPIRAMKTVGETIYVVAGNFAYSISSGKVTTLGQINTTTGPAYIEWNSTATSAPKANQVGFWDQTSLWVWNPGNLTFTQILLPFSEAPMGPTTFGGVAFLDGLALTVQQSTFNVYQSNVNDFTTWDALNFTTEDGNSEPVIALSARNDQVVFHKQNSTCFYVNEGNNGFVFGREVGIYPAIGCAAQSSVVVVNNITCFLGHTSKGGPKVYMMPGYEPLPISTYAIENTLAEYSRVDDAIGWGYVQEGHAFYGLNFPTAGETWVVDLAETHKLGVGVWHQRAGFVPGGFTNYVGSCCTQMDDQVYMGDATSGNIYLLSLDNFLDNGQTRKWLRSWRADHGPTKYAAEKCNYVDFQVGSGVNTPVGTNPLMMFEQSFDNGYNWQTQRFIPLGTQGSYQQTVRARRLGATNRGINSDRSFRISGTDPWGGAILGAEVG